MLSLPSEQRRQIVQTAATLTPKVRSAFIAVVESTLSRHCRGRAPSRNDVQRVIAYVLGAVRWPRSSIRLRFGAFE
jgi:hypothetical protein